jgi:hypothetical protein
MYGKIASGSDPMSKYQIYSAVKVTARMLSHCWDPRTKKQLFSVARNKKVSEDG